MTSPMIACPACGHDRQVHFAEDDSPAWGCYVDGCGCNAGYELIGDLIAGRLRPEGDRQLDALQDEVDRRMATRQDTFIPMGRQGELAPVSPGMFADAEVADNLILGTVALESPLGPIAGLLFRFAASGPKPHRFRDRMFVVPSTEILDGLEGLFGDAVALARKVLER